ncbi:MAG TPA: FAD:protein FMN transferase [Candidatus Dormibacteraeota bacterium]|jgi:thiamine biosynthesis lipoprotein
MRPENSIESHHFEALGTTCALFAVGLARARLLEAEDWTRRTGARLTRFSPDSELSILNASAGRWVDVGAELEAVLRESLLAFELSAGLVNVAVLPAMLAAGYTRSLAEGPTVATLDARGVPRLPDVLEVGRGRARIAPGSGVDLGGIAKGWMADRLCEMFGPNFVANLGGDLRAAGAGPRGDGWPVGIGGTTLALRDHGAATSSVRRRRWGAALHHLIDPRSGLPARTGLDEVSVVARSAVEAEVVAKTALVLGPDLAPAYCARHALAYWLEASHDG